MAIKIYGRNVFDTKAVMWNRVHNYEKNYRTYTDETPKLYPCCYIFTVVRRKQIDSVCNSILCRIYDSVSPCDSGYFNLNSGNLNTFMYEKLIVTHVNTGTCHGLFWRVFKYLYLLYNLHIILYYVALLLQSMTIYSYIYIKYNIMPVT